MNRLIGLAVCVVFLTSSILAQNVGAPGQRKGVGTVVLKAARVIDGTGAAAIANGVVVILDDKIMAVGPASTVRIPSGAKVIDLGDATLMPGFIDGHTHIIGRTLGDPEAGGSTFRDPDSFAILLGARNAERTLMAGFTTIRDLGAGNFDDLTLKRAINEGWAVGPRIYGAGHALGITGGHCDDNGFKPGVADGDFKTGIADGVDQVRAAVRYQIKYGADLIKTCATAGVLSEGTAAVGTTQYTFDELKAMVDEAKKAGRKVTAHAHGADGIKVATRAGVASIEHGSFLDEEGAKLMAANGTYLVPTLVAGEGVERLAKNSVLRGLRAEKALSAATAMRNSLKIAVANKVPIAFGTDAGVVPHGSNGHEFTLMVEWGGMSPMDAIVAGTLNGAKLLGVDNIIGTLSVGKLADIVAVPGNPLTDIKRMESVSFVMKNGAIYKQEK